jgi:hypothetical protein
MQKIRITHKDGDMQGIILIYLVNKYMIEKGLWEIK